MIANLSGTPSRLCQAAIGNSSTTLYTAKSDGKTAILDAQICNTTSAAKTVRLCIGSISTYTALLYDVSIAPNSIIQIDGFQILNANEILVASASDTGLTITISGLERV
jgi:hypothetical protein